MHLVVAISTGISHFTNSLRQADAWTTAQYWMSLAARVACTRLEVLRLFYRCCLFYGIRWLQRLSLRLGLLLHPKGSKSQDAIALQLRNIGSSMCFKFIVLGRMPLTSKLRPALATRCHTTSWLFINKGVKISKLRHAKVCQSENTSQQQRDKLWSHRKRKKKNISIPPCWFAVSFPKGNNREQSQTSHCASFPEFEWFHAFGEMCHAQESIKVPANSVNLSVHEFLTLQVNGPQMRED